MAHGSWEEATRISTDLGDAVLGDSLDYMEDLAWWTSVTSPPFGLVRKKDYGNEDAEDYVDWFDAFGKQSSGFSSLRAAWSSISAAHGPRALPHGASTISGC